MRTPTEIRAFLEKERYNQYIVSDARSFSNCIPAESKEEVLALVDNCKIGPRIGMVSKKPKIKEYMASQKNTNSNLDLSGHKVAECNNFAIHALVTLAANKTIREKYNIVKVASMLIGGVFKHNHLILVPKNAELNLCDQPVEGKVGLGLPRMWGSPPLPENAPKNAVSGLLPLGSLIVDPWARGLGHPANTCMAVPIDRFVFSDSVYPFEVHYQSALDDTLEEAFEGVLGAAAGGDQLEVHPVVPVVPAIPVSPVVPPAPSAIVDVKQIDLNQAAVASLKQKAISLETQTKQLFAAMAAQPPAELEQSHQMLKKLVRQAKEIQGQISYEHAKAEKINQLVGDSSIIGHWLDGPVSQKFYALVNDKTEAEVLIKSIEKIISDTPDLMAKKQLEIIQQQLMNKQLIPLKGIHRAAHNLQDIQALLKKNNHHVEKIVSLDIDRNLNSINSALIEADAAKKETDALLQEAITVASEHPAAASDLSRLKTTKEILDKQVQQLGKIKEEAEQSIASLQVTQARGIIKELITEGLLLIAEATKKIRTHDKEAPAKIKEISEEIKYMRQQIDQIKGQAEKAALLINDKQQWFVAWNDPVQIEFKGLQDDIKTFETIELGIGALSEKAAAHIQPFVRLPQEPAAAAPVVVERVEADLRAQLQAGRRSEADNEAGNDNKPVSP